MEEGTKEKVKEWFTFLTIVVDKMYLSNGIQVELLRLNFTLSSLFLRIDSIFQT